MTVLAPTQVKILAVCDEVDARLYGSQRGPMQQQLQATPDVMISCGDLPAYYLDNLVSKLDVPLYAVHGNHDTPPSRGGAEGFSQCGAHWLGGRGVRTPGGLLLAGFDGSLRYNKGAYQSSQAEMQAAVHSLVPWMVLNRLRYGRFLDLLITHAPPLGVHD